MAIPKTLVQKLPDMDGSETKAVLAIYSEGRALDASDLNVITGMSKSTCYRVMKSEVVKEAAKHVSKVGSKEDKDVPQYLRELADELETNPHAH